MTDIDDLDTGLFARATAQAFEDGAKRASSTDILAALEKASVAAVSCADLLRSLARLLDKVHDELAERTAETEEDYA